MSPISQQTVSTSAPKDVLDALPRGVLGVDERATIAYANPTVARVLGYPDCATVVGRSVFELMASSDREAAQAHVTAWQQGRPPAPRRTRVWGAAGEVLVDVAPLPGWVWLDGTRVLLSLVDSVEDPTGVERQRARQAYLMRGTADLARALADAGLELEAVLQVAVRVAAPHPTEVALLQLFTHDQKGLERTTTFHAADPRLREVVQRFASPTVTTDISRAVLESGQVLVLDRQRFLARVSDTGRKKVGDQVPHALVVAPMRAHGRTLGLLSVSRHQPVPFEGDEISFLQDVADRSAQAVLNAQLHDDVKRALRASDQAKEALLTTEAALRHSQKLEALGQLAGGVAHDFNNLLSVILGLSSILLERKAPDDPDTADLLDIKAAGERAAELTRQLLAFSRKQVMQSQPLDVNDVLSSSERTLRRLLTDDVTLRLELGQGLPQVSADPSLLTQVVLNLVLNARDAMPRGGAVTVRTSAASLTQPQPHAPRELGAGDYVRLEVVDEGVGIAPEVMEHLFEPFFTTKARGKGAGLGLSTGYGIARQSGGTLTATSQVGQGSTFTLWLPVLKHAAPRSPTPPPIVAQGPGRVLLVEDEPGVREVAQRILRRAGYTVHAASSAEEALAIEGSLGVLELLLTDVVMPGKSGRELAAILGERRPGLPVLYMSGYTEDQVLQRGVQDGALVLLPKPFTPQKLLEAVAGALVRERPSSDGAS